MGDAVQDDQANFEYQMMKLVGKLINATHIIRDHGLRAFLVILVSHYRIPIRLSPKFKWEAGIRSEIQFWDRWFSTKGLRWPGVYLQRLDPHFPLQQRPASLLPAARNCLILDVGAGPLTSLGKTHPGKTIEIIAIDPLADYYDRLLEKYRITPNVRTIKMDAENIQNGFPEDMFDLVYASNAIDHSYDPERAILQMLRVVKPGCYILLEHALNEAENESYYGFHQWNFSMSTDGDFLIGSKTSMTNMTQKYSAICKIGCEIVAGSTLITRILRLP